MDGLPVGGEEEEVVGLMEGEEVEVGLPEGVSIEVGLVDDVPAEVGLGEVTNPEVLVKVGFSVSVVAGLLDEGKVSDRIGTELAEIKVETVGMLALALKGALGSLISLKSGTVVALGQL